jgi:hypothetical protein
LKVSIAEKNVDPRVSANNEAEYLYTHADVVVREAALGVNVHLCPYPPVNTRE